MRKAVILILVFVLPFSAAGAKDIELKDAIERTIDENLDVKIEKRNSLIQTSMWKAEKSIFDPVLSLDVFFQDATEPQASSFLTGTDVTQSKSKGYSLSLGGKAPTGMNYNFSVSDNRRDTNATVYRINPKASVNATLDLEQPLLKEFGIKNTKTSILVAKNDKSISDNEFEMKVIDKVKEVADAYYNLVYARKNLELKKQSLELAQQLLERTKTRVDVGMLPPTEIDQSRAGAAQRKEAVVVTENSLKQAEDRLKKIMNYSLKNEIWSSTLNPDEYRKFENPKLDMEEAMKTARKHRLEMKNASWRIKNARLKAQKSKNELKPQLNLNARLSYNGLAGDLRLRRTNPITGNTTTTVIPGSFSNAYYQIRDREYETWRLGLSFQYPIFNRAAESSYATNRLNLQQQELYKDRVEENIFVEIRNAIREVKTNRERIRTTKANRKLQKTKLEAEKERYKNGLSTSYDVLEFQKDLMSAKTSVLKAKIDYYKSVITLQKARGTLLETFNLELDI